MFVLITQVKRHCLYSHVKPRPQNIIWLIYILEPRPPPTNCSVTTEHYQVNLHTKPRLLWRACWFIYPGSSAEKEENHRLSEKFSCGERIGLDQAEDRRRIALSGLFIVTINCIHHGRTKIRRARDHSQSQSGQTVVDLWKT